MHEKIITELDKIEKSEDVNILYAVESGSRAWGFPSKDSDYDVRFIYTRRHNSYLTIEEDRDVLEYPINDLLDISGWDIRKSLKLFRKSNPPLSEWLISPIIYIESSEFTNNLRKLHSEYFSPKSCSYHYLSMAKRNYREYMKGDFVKIKKYFYVLRPVLSCIWIERNGTMPPMEFQKLLELITEEKELKSEIDTLLERKIAGEELDMQPAIKIINHFLEGEIKRLESVAQNIDVTQKPPRKHLDHLFQNTLDEVWLG